MPKATPYFSQDYDEARAKFKDATKAAGGTLEHFLNEAERGLKGEELSTDVAWHGPKDAEAVLVTISGTHGAEGFCGSGVQIGWLESGLVEEMPANTALLQIHAINPYGFSWIRRVTEDNVDLNRNFLDHTAGNWPENPGYNELAEVICPKEWDDATIASANAVLLAYADEHGATALQSAISGGQYNHADGIFYGGRHDTWSKVTLHEILDRYLGKAKRVALIDYHTGLGPRGYGERICVHQPGSPGIQRAEAFYDGDITSPYLGSSSSVPLHGVNLLGIEAAIPHADLTAVALEYGTRPTLEVKHALRADNWLHLHGKIDSKKGQAIKEDIRAAFYQDADDWKAMIWERGVETQRMALNGLWS